MSSGSSSFAALYPIIHSTLKGPRDNILSFMGLFFNF